MGPGRVLSRADDRSSPRGRAEPTGSGQNMLTFYSIRETPSPKTHLQSKSSAMKKITLHLVLTILAVQVSWGMAAGLSLPDAITKADIIAHIRIDDDLELIPMFTKTKTSDGKITYSPNSTDPQKYRKIATASVVYAFKAPETENKIKILHTNGFTCPNVIYRKGKEYIVFLRKETDSNHYVTMNSYAGQFKIEDGHVMGFYLMDGYKRPEDLRLPYERVTTFLKESIQRTHSANGARPLIIGFHSTP